MKATMLIGFLLIALIAAGACDRPNALVGPSRTTPPSVLGDCLETLRIVALLASPVMPAAAGRLWEQLGVVSPLDEQRLPAAAAWGGLAPGTVTRKGDALFPRLSS